jgi:hypothetical protein
MKTRFYAILFISITFFFIACEEDSITEAVLGSNSISLSGDITDSFDAPSFAGFSVEDASFTLMMSPNLDTETYEDILILYKESGTLPSVGTYGVNAHVNDANTFHALYTVNDSTIYQMDSGTVEITGSSSSRIEGTFDMSGDLFGLLIIDPARILNVTGKFSAIPIE